MFLYIKINYQKEKLRKQLHLQLHQKYLKINLTKSVKSLYSKNEKALKKSKKIKINGSIYTVLIDRKINVSKMSIVYYAIYRFHAIPIKIPMAYFTDLEQISPNLYGTKKDPK